jgi:hypothetical protein
MDVDLSSRQFVLNVVDGDGLNPVLLTPLECLSQQFLRRLNLTHGERRRMHVMSEREVELPHHRVAESATRAARHTGVSVTFQSRARRYRHRHARSQKEAARGSRSHSARLRSSRTNFCSGVSLYGGCVDGLEWVRRICISVLLACTQAHSTRT